MSSLRDRLHEAIDRARALPADQVEAFKETSVGLILEVCQLMYTAGARHAIEACDRFQAVCREHAMEHIAGQAGMLDWNAIFNAERGKSDEPHTRD